MVGLPAEGSVSKVGRPGNGCRERRGRGPRAGGQRGNGRHGEGSQTRPRGRERCAPQNCRSCGATKRPGKRRAPAGRRAEGRESPAPPVRPALDRTKRRLDRFLGREYNAVTSYSAYEWPLIASCWTILAGEQIRAGRGLPGVRRGSLPPPSATAAAGALSPSSTARWPLSEKPASRSLAHGIFPPPGSSEPLRRGCFPAHSQQRWVRVARAGGRPGLAGRSDDGRGGAGASHTETKGDLRTPWRPLGLVLLATVSCACPDRTGDRAGRSAAFQPPLCCRARPLGGSGCGCAMTAVMLRW